MEVITSPKDMQKKAVFDFHGQTGFVPTMGALHEGHLSLIKQARQECDTLVSSIFINPTQFLPGEDFEKYPKRHKEDMELLKTNGVDVLFLPTPESMYPDGFNTVVIVSNITERLCGLIRPGHFQGVTTVVLKLLNIVKPQRAYFGQKDYQQTLVIKKMAEDLNLFTEIVVCPTVREKDGLALSSRNQYLNPEERKEATLIYKSMIAVKEGLVTKQLQLSDVPKKLAKILESGTLKKNIQYASIYDPSTLEEIKDNSFKGNRVLIAIALKLANTRLIDNMLINP